MSPDITLRAQVGYFGQTPKDGASAFVLLDGQKKFERLGLGRDDGLQDISLAIPASVRFLTLMATDHGNDIGHDQVSLRRCATGNCLQQSGRSQNRDRNKASGRASGAAQELAWSPQRSTPPYPKHLPPFMSSFVAIRSKMATKSRPAPSPAFPILNRPLATRRRRFRTTHRVSELDLFGEQSAHSTSDREPIVASSFSDRSGSA